MTALALPQPTRAPLDVRMKVGDRELRQTVRLNWDMTVECA